MTSYLDYIKTPIGFMEIRASEKALTSVLFIDDVDEASDIVDITDVRKNTITQSCKEQLKAYFNGELTKFDLPLSFEGTDFQEDVWSSLKTIPYGETLSYKDIGALIRNPKAVRAVGAANAKNKLYILLPCHRVIASNGALSGYAGGVERKAWLLKHEGAEFTA